MKKRIRLTESDLHEIVKESVKRVIREYNEYDGFEPEYDFDDDVSDIINRINRGDYDDKLDQIMKDPFGYYNDEGVDIIQAADDRKCVLDKNYAIKYGEDPDKPLFIPRYHPNPFKPNALGDEYWQDKEAQEAAAKYPSMLTKKGILRKRKGKSIADIVNKGVYGTDQADKRPLHRKGSLNREI